MEKYERKPPTTMRLKGFWRDRRGDGQRFIYKLERYFWCIRYAAKRAWIGYDDVDVFDVGYRTAERLIDTLSEFAVDHREHVDAPDVDAAALKIIDLLGYYDEERAFKELFPDAPITERELCDYKFTAPDYTVEQIKEAYALQSAKLKEAFTLFGEYCERFWI